MKVKSNKSHLIKVIFIIGASELLMCRDTVSNERSRMVGGFSNEQVTSDLGKGLMSQK
jgi:hypothetical protein